MTPDTLSKSKLLAFLKSQHVDTGETMNTIRYVYCTGKNQICDAIAVAIYAGDFDE